MQVWIRLARGLRDDRMMNRMGYLIYFKSRDIVREKEFNYYLLYLYFYIYLGQNGDENESGSIFVLASWEPVFTSAQSETDVSF